TSTEHPWGAPGAAGGSGGAVGGEPDHRRGGEVLRSRGPREGLCDEVLDRGEASFDRAGGGVVEHRIGREELVEGVVVATVEGIAVAGDQVLDLESIRHFLQRHGHGATDPKSSTPEGA